jgi:hypothetical protein
MVRTVITPNKQFVSFEIPVSYIGKEIEVIAFAKDEGEQKIFDDTKQKSFSALSLDTRNYKFSRDEANER